MKLQRKRWVYDHVREYYRYHLELTWLGVVVWYTVGFAILVALCLLMYWFSIN